MMIHLNSSHIGSGIGRRIIHSSGALLFLCFVSLIIYAGCGIADTNRDKSQPDNGTGGSTAATAGMSGPSRSAAASASPDPAGNTAGLTSVEAAQLVWPKAKSNFDDAVLFRMAPVAGKDSTKLMLAGDWLKTGRSANWFIWYADPDGQDWLMFAVRGTKLDKTDIGTRSFSVMPMGADWPRDKPAVAIEDAAAAASVQGADMDALTWVELSCDYPASDYRRHPYWVFAFSETAASGLTLNYRIFIDAITGKAAGALNDRNEKMLLPVDKAILGTPRKDSHQNDLQKFLDLLIRKDWAAGLLQLSHNMAPDDSVRQMWQANFQSLDSLEIVSIEPANLINWTDNYESYKVILKIKTKEPVEKYGWENGDNTRWITIIPQGAGSWKIESIAGSP